MEQGKRILVRQVRSIASKEPAVVNTIRALGLGRIGSQREYTLNASLQGMLERVRHLVKISQM